MGLQQIEGAGHSVPKQDMRSFLMYVQCDGVCGASVAVDTTPGEINKHYRVLLRKREGFASKFERMNEIGTNWYSKLPRLLFYTQITYSFIFILRVILIPILTFKSPTNCAPTTYYDSLHGLYLMPHLE